MNKFKVGDKIVHKTYGWEDIVTEIPGMKSYDNKGYIRPEEGMVTKNHAWEMQKNWQLVEAIPLDNKSIQARLEYLLNALRAERQQ